MQGRNSEQRGRNKHLQAEEENREGRGIPVENEEERMTALCGRRRLPMPVSPRITRSYAVFSITADERDVQMQNE
jgi:hypothetical protein